MEPSGPVQTCNGTDLPLLHDYKAISDVTETNNSAAVYPFIKMNVSNVKFPSRQNRSVRLSVRTQLKKNFMKLH
jgi:hypothetical protein